MNNVLQLKDSSLSVTTGISLPGSLRWLRRAMTLILIVANFALAMWVR